eukprot:scaffold127200_cov31-Tisochrysis_lutea.AAC.4
MGMGGIGNAAYLTFNQSQKSKWSDKAREEEIVIVTIGRHHPQQRAEGRQATHTSAWQSMGEAWL